MSALAEAAAPARPAAPDWRAGGFGLYVHWPFCLAKCPYCDFNSHVRRGVDHDAWRRALLAEMAHVRGLTGPRRLDTMFFGGGTPSLMAPATVAALIEEAGRLWGFGRAPEITLEANPTSVEASSFAAYAQGGVNRVSLGVQALDDPALRALGRMHTGSEALAALEVARRHFDRVSFDLIYARPGQTAAEWEDELGRAIALGPDHLSLYQLTIEDGTRFGELHRLGRLAVPPDDAAAEMYALTQTVTAGCGLPAYEVSNHARPGAESRHNLVYWRYGDYAGIGPGAHGRITGPDGTRLATATERGPEAWLARVATDGHGLTEAEPVGAKDQATEMMLMGLRLAEGIDPGRYARLAGRPLDPARLEPLIAGGLVRRQGARLAATPEGRMVLNSVLATLLA